MDDIGSTSRSAGHTLTDTMKLPVACAEASHVRWRWSLVGESEPVYFSATFAPDDGSSAVVVFAPLLLPAHASDRVVTEGAGTLELRWSVPSAHEGWWLSQSEAVTLEFECRVLPARELRRRARDVRLGVLRELVADQKLAAQTLREQNQHYQASLEELRAQMVVIEEHIAAQEAQALQAEARAAEYNGERLRLLEHAMAENHTEIEEISTPTPASLRTIVED